MKIWKKVYLFALIITTLCINIGFLGIIYITYQHMLKAEKERCEMEYRILQANISEDIIEMESAVALDETYFKQYINAYNSYYEGDTKLIGLILDEVVTEEKNYENLPKENGVWIFQEEQTVIYISQPLDKWHMAYRIVMRKTLDNFDAIWNTLQPLYIMGGILLSLSTSLLLAGTVRMVLKPMDELEFAAKQVQNGNWSARVKIKGNNELAQLGNQFNAMASTVQEQIQKLEEQSKQKQELINNLAHEMNTPITSIQGFADYMRIGNLSEEEETECLEFIINESKRLKQISDTLLSMACMQNQQELLQSKFSIKQLCEKLDNIYKKQFERRTNNPPLQMREALSGGFGGFLCQVGIEKPYLTSCEAACVHEEVAKADSECPLYNNFISLSMNCEIETMQGNEILIESLLRNLITNAHHAILQKRDMQVLEVTRNSEKKNMVVLNNEISNKEEGIIEVQIFSIEQGIKIVVSDNGCGMKEEDRKQIFEPFYRVNKARSRENGGSGLGLAFCKKIVELHHGKIEVESKVGIGTKFSILL